MRDEHAPWSAPFRSWRASGVMRQRQQAVRHCHSFLRLQAWMALMRNSMAKEIASITVAITVAPP